MTSPKPKVGETRPKSRFRPKPIRRSEEGRRILREQEELRRQRIREQEQEEAIRRLRSNDRHLLFCVYCKRLGHIVSRCSRVATKSSSGRHVVTSHLSPCLGSRRRTKPKTRWVPTNATVHQSYHAPGVPPAGCQLQNSGAGDCKPIPLRGARRFPISIIDSMFFQCLDYPTPRVRFPELKGCMTHLMNKLTQDEVEDAKFVEYHALIAQLNSHNITTDALIREAIV
ncbi:uncharacterized protein B0H64DRAFT_8473 [Chaetomium fimeti]|uniref:Uncharacterized protein n=1 Tax=Chaetomium fimeti TaxID=1854472 RepID=A0AAE0LWI3_9PEZI|nr:hypothetical protein B0H64DRAFT_8473 [Chaetomium fimeti]